MNKRNAGIGIVAIGIAIGMSLNGWFKGAGTGSSGDNETASSTDDQSRDEVDRPLFATTVTETSTGASREIEPNNVLEIIVAEDGYELKKEGNMAEPAELERVINLAKVTSGNDAGIRVRIFKRKSSLPTAEIALKQALDQAGLPEQSIYWEEELLD